MAARSLFLLLLIGLSCNAVAQKNVTPKKQPQDQPGSAAVQSAQLRYVTPESRIKDLGRFVGDRTNQLLGYGLVTGLDQSGDSRSTLFTVQSITNMLTKYGITVPPTSVKLKNVAAVMVTCELPPFVRRGAKLDVQVSSIGDAKSLQGGILLQTPLLGADGQVYAVAQGALSIGGFNYGGGAGKILKNHTTVGRIPKGATLENEVPTLVTDGAVAFFQLNAPDFTTAERIAAAINTGVPEVSATPQDAGAVRIQATAGELTVAKLSQIEEQLVQAASRAVIVVNERTGTISIGADVKLRPGAIAHGNIVASIAEIERVIQPPSFTGRGAPDKERNTNVRVAEDDTRVIPFVGAATVGDVVKALNAIGATPRDLIAILQSMAESGMLVAEIRIQ
jgi:flagellar P-ring protein precursor FlgI